MNIKLKTLPICLSMCADLVIAQASTVTSFVIPEDDNEAIADTTTLIKDATIRAITDINGKFSLSSLSSAESSSNSTYWNEISEDIPCRFDIIFRNSSESVCTIACASIKY